MTPLPQRFFHTGPVLGVVLDWAGTTVESMADILPVIDEISDRLSRGDHPLHH